MARQPACPQCKTAVGPSWDWCHTCGYDPAGLKPEGWTPAPVPASVAAPTSGARTPATAPAPVPARPTTPGPGSSPATGTSTWVAPAPAGRGRTTAVTTLVDPGAARPQEMRDPDWVQQEPRHGLPLPAVVGLVAVVAAAVVGLVVVTLIVLHRPIGTADDGAPHIGPVPAHVGSLD